MELHLYRQIAAPPVNKVEHLRVEHGLVDARHQQRPGQGKNDGEPHQHIQSDEERCDGQLD